MKILSIILSLYILCLAFAPALEMIDLTSEVQCCEHSCTPVDDTDHQQESEGEGCCDDICNPFIRCHCCMGFTASMVINSPDLLPCLEAKGLQHKKLFSPPVIFSIWHPPQTA